MELEMINTVNQTDQQNARKAEIEDSKPEPKTEPEPECHILQAGSKIRPEVDACEVKRIAERLYGITSKYIGELPSYDDRNFLIHADRNIKNPLIASTWAYGYVLKITNELDSQKSSLIDAQTQMMLYLDTQNITCPKPVANVFGKYFSLETFGKAKYIVRLLEYLPGKILVEVPPTEHLFYQTGEFVAQFDRALKNFEHEAYKTYKSLWHLDNVPKLIDFVHEVKDQSKLEIVEEVIAAFEKKVIANDEIFEKGLIHGDFNEQNILVHLVGKTKAGTEHKISGIIDFGDTSESNLVFELAIAMAYMMILSKDVTSGGFVLAGYTSVRVIPEAEKKVLRTCIAARLCQSLVMGAYTHSLDPDNDYLLITQEPGWIVLETLWAMSDDHFNDLMDVTADAYLKQSIK